MLNRRRFLKVAALAGGGIYAGSESLPASARAPLEPTPQADAKLDLLVLGGTGFIGPHLVRHAVTRGHRVTIFTRGRRDSRSFPPRSSG